MPDLIMSSKPVDVAGAVVGPGLALKTSTELLRAPNVWIQLPVAKLTFAQIGARLVVDATGVYYVPREPTQPTVEFLAELEEWRGIAADSLFAFEDSLPDEP